MWTVIRSGSRVEVRHGVTGERIATVGEDKDPRLIKRISDATIIAQAPHMLEALIDVQELVKREFIDTSHPLAELVTTKINDIIKKSFIAQRGFHEQRQDTNFRIEADRQNSRGTDNLLERETTGPDLRVV